MLSSRTITVNLNKKLFQKREPNLRMSINSKTKLKKNQLKFKSFSNNLCREKEIREILLSSQQEQAQGLLVAMVHLLAVTITAPIELLVDKV